MKCLGLAKFITSLLQSIWVRLLVVKKSKKTFYIFIVYILIWASTCLGHQLVTYLFLSQMWIKIMYLLIEWCSKHYLIVSKVSILYIMIEQMKVISLSNVCYVLCIPLKSSYFSLNYNLIYRSKVYIFFFNNNVANWNPE